MSLWELFKEGGWVMYPLLLCLIASIYVVVDRVWLIFSLKKDAKQIAQKIENNEKDFSSFHQLIEAPYSFVLNNSHQNEGDLKDSSERNVSKIKETVGKKLWILASVASASPFIGLFGTVVGIIKSFDDIAKAGKGGFAVVAAGLSEALIATAAGIIVAVIAVLFFNYLKNMLGGLIFDYSYHLFETIEKIKRK